MLTKRDNSSLLAIKARKLSHTASEYRVSNMKCKALKTFKQALRLFTSVGDISGEAICLNNIGLILESKGKLKKALQTYRKVLFIDINQKNTLEEGITISNIGRVYEKLHDYQNALLNCNKALVIFS